MIMIFGAEGVIIGEGRGVIVGVSEAGGVAVLAIGGASGWQAAPTIIIKEISNALISIGDLLSLSYDLIISSSKAWAFPVRPGCLR